MSTITHQSSKLAGLRRVSRRLRGLVFIMPALAVLVALRLYPLVDAIRLSFTAWDGFSDPVPIGSDNYRRLVDDPVFRDAVANNLKILIIMPVWVLVPLLVAQALHARIPGWRFFRVAFFLPAVLSPVVLGIYYSLLLQPDGPVNAALAKLGLGTQRDWLNQPTLAFVIMVGIMVWSTAGVGVLIYLAGLSNFDTQVLEAAQIDGASAWQTQRHIVFWLMMPVIRFWTVIVLIFSFTGIFPLIFALTGGGPGHATYVVEFSLYQQAFESGQLGYASAIGVFLLIFVGVVIAGLSLLLKDRD